jgi:molybdate transport system ATP-binding protein
VNLISVTELTAVLSGRQVLTDISLNIETGKSSAFVGPNGSGKTALASFISGHLKIPDAQPIYEKNLNPDTEIAFVSFEFQQELYDIDDYFDDTDFMDGVQDKGTTAREAILLSHKESELFQQIIQLLGIRYLLERGIRFLSTGEIRKVLIARALLNKPKLLIIDSPFEGLDRKSRSFMHEMINNLLKEQQCLLLLNEDDEVLDLCDNIYCMDQGSIITEGHAGILRNTPYWKKHFSKTHKQLKVPAHHLNSEVLSIQANTPLIEMKNVSVKYGDVTALNNMTWKVMPGENWLISGSNGAGKSTLLSLITADNPQAYGKDFHLFGRKRGTGETIWDIKKRIGIITSKLQLSYRQPLSALQVVVSGFFDSIGLYQKADPQQIALAREWLGLLEINDIEKRYFNELSYGEQRMILLARAMVKHPLLLVLDEPCQGLDSSNRQAVLDLVDYIAFNSKTQILYVSHCHEEDLQCINRKLTFSKSENGLFDASCSKI